MLGNLVPTLRVSRHLVISRAAVIRLPYLIGTIGRSSRRSSCCTTHTVQNVPLFCSSCSHKLTTLGKCHIIGMSFVLWFHLSLLLFLFFSIHFVCLKIFVNYCNKNRESFPQVCVSVPPVVSSLPYSARCLKSPRPKFSSSLTQTFYHFTHLSPSYLISALLVLSRLPRTHLGSSYLILLSLALAIVANQKLSRTWLSRQAVRKPQLHITFSLASACNAEAAHHRHILHSISDTIILTEILGTRKGSQPWHPSSRKPVHSHEWEHPEHPHGPLPLMRNQTQMTKTFTKIQTTQKTSDWKSS